MFQKLIRPLEGVLQKSFEISADFRKIFEVLAEVGRRLMEVVRKYLETFRQIAGTILQVYHDFGRTLFRAPEKAGHSSSIIQPPRRGLSYRRLS